MSDFSLRLAHCGPPEALISGLSAQRARTPALLVSFVYLEPFLRNQSRYHYRDWVLDSGAFSAHTSGKEIKLADYIATCKRLRESDPTLTEIFALDVIGDARASRRNCEAMWSAGVPAIPTFHRGSPWAELVSLAGEYPKIALGGVAMLRGHEKLNFAKECFARVWPKRIHGFGYGAENQVLALPWHSVDATNWEIGPCAFGRWNSMGGKFSVRGSNQNLRGEVEWYLELERKAQHKWRKTLAVLGQQDEFAREISIRLAASGGSSGTVTARYEALMQE